MFDLVILAQRLVNAADDDVMAAASLVSPKGMLVAHMHETECTPAMPLPSRIATLQSNFKDRLAWMEPFCALFPLGGVGVIFGGAECPRLSEADAERISTTLREQSIESKHLDTPSKAAALLHKPRFGRPCSAAPHRRKARAWSWPA